MSNLWGRWNTSVNSTFVYLSLSLSSIPLMLFFSILCSAPLSCLYVFDYLNNLIPVEKWCDKSRLQLQSALLTFLAFSSLPFYLTPENHDISLSVQLQSNSWSWTLASSLTGYQLLFCFINLASGSLKEESFCCFGQNQLLQKKLPLIMQFRGIGIFFQNL